MVNVIYKLFAVILLLRILLLIVVAVKVGVVNFVGLSIDLNLKICCIMRVKCGFWFFIIIDIFGIRFLVFKVIFKLIILLLVIVNRVLVFLILVIFKVEDKFVFFLIIVIFIDLVILRNWYLGLGFIIIIL